MAAKPKYPQQVGTLGGIIRERRSLSIYCQRIGCRNYRHVDLPALVAKLGADYPLRDFVARSKCSKCGAKWPDFQLTLVPTGTGSPPAGPLAP